MCSWQVVVACCGPCGEPSMTSEHMPQMPSRQSWSNATGSSPSRMSRSLSTSSISRKDMSGEMPSSSYGTIRPLSAAFFCRQIFSVSLMPAHPPKLSTTARTNLPRPTATLDNGSGVGPPGRAGRGPGSGSTPGPAFVPGSALVPGSACAPGSALVSGSALASRPACAGGLAGVGGSFVRPLDHLHVLVLQVLLVEDRGLAGAGVLPGRDVGEVLVVAQRLALRGLGLGAEVAAAGLRTVQGVDAHQLGQLEEGRDAPGLLQRLVQLLVLPRHLDVAPELRAQLPDPVQGLAQALSRTFHAAVLPHEGAELAVEGVRRTVPVDGQEPLDPLDDGPAGRDHGLVVVADL